LLVGFLGGGHARGDPAGEGGLEGQRVEAAEEFAEAGGGRRLAAQEPQSMGQRDPVVAAELGDGGGPLAAAEHGEHGQGEEGEQRVTAAVPAAGVRDFGEGIQERKRGHEGASGKDGRGCLLYSIPLSLPISISV
jgi:hypothetical protein